jgi:hypothetical protein
MEVTALLELSGIDTSTKISRADIKYADQQHLYLGNGESEWAVPLHYDYFLLDKGERVLYLREEYDSVVPQLMVQADKKDVQLRARRP